MRKLWLRWVGRIAHTEPATPLALFRIAVGLVLLYTHLTMLWSGSVVIWIHRDHGGIHPLSAQQWLIGWLGGPSADTIHGLIAVGLVAAVTLIVGLFGRLSALVGLQVSLALFSLLPASGGGHDRLITNALWILLLAGSTTTLSLDARIRTGRWRTDTPVSAWPRYVLLFQLCLVYTVTGIHKLGSSWFPWGDYSAVYYAMLTPNWARYDVVSADWIAWIYPLTQVGTAVTWIWEVSFPMVLLWLWWRHTADRGGRLRAFARRVDLRVLYAVVGLVMHGSLFFLMELGPFSFITLSFYVAMWHHDELVRWLPWLGPPALVAEVPAGGAPATP